MNIEVGQVLSLRIRFNNSGTISKNKHPYLVVGVDKESKLLEVAQIDSLAGKEYKAIIFGNLVIPYDNPLETVIDKDSYIQLDNTIKLAYFEDLTKHRRQIGKLSKDKLVMVLAAYKDYHKRYEIDENKVVNMDEDEIRNLNS
jgi:hypothetical protein